MKQCKCKECGNIQDYNLLNCENCSAEMPKVAYKTKATITKTEHTNKEEYSKEDKLLMKNKIKLPWQGILMGIGNGITSVMIITFTLYDVYTGSISVKDASIVLIFFVIPLLLAWGFLTKRRWAPVISLILYIIGVVIGISYAIQNPEVKLKFVALLFVVFFIYCDLVCIGHPAYIKNK
jgi:VIT1/CCC1 family predicted Fe2+/Mn2+ transporter